MEFQKTNLRDVILIKPTTTTDFRGDFAMLYNKKLYEPVVGNLDFIEQDISTTTKGVLRGIHYCPNSWKINQCLYGKIYYVCVNCDENDPEFGKWQEFILSDVNRYQLFKHPRYATGFYTLSDMSIFHYLQSQYYEEGMSEQKTFRWDDPRFNIWWPTKNPILSMRDESGQAGWEE